MKVSILCLQSFDSFLVCFNCGFVLTLPLFDNPLLHKHYLKRLFFAVLCLFSGLKKLILELSNFEVAFIIELGDSIMVNGLHASNFSQGGVFFISQAVHEFSKSLVFLEVALVVSHIGIKFDFLFMHHNLLLGMVLSQVVIFILESLILVLD